MAYDISDDKRRDRLAVLLGRFGHRVQYSVFECQLDDEQLEQVLAAAGRILESSDNGSVRFYRWCGACRNASIGLGAVEDVDDGEAFII